MIEQNTHSPESSEAVDKRLRRLVGALFTDGLQQDEQGNSYFEVTDMKTRTSERIMADSIQELMDILDPKGVQREMGRSALEPVVSMPLNTGIDREPFIEDDMSRTLSGDEADKLRSDLAELRTKPAVIDSVPGYSPDPKDSSSPSVEYGHVVHNVPMPADPRHVLGWNPEVAAMQKAYAESLRETQTVNPQLEQRLGQLPGREQ